MSHYEFYGGGGVPKDGLSSYSLSMRPCPGCRRKMRTDREGRFTCPGCGYSDTQNVQKLKKSGLGYASDHGGWTTHNFLHGRADDD